MKRMLYLIFAVVLCLSVLSGCAEPTTNLIKYEDNRYTITLPISKSTVWVDKCYEHYLPKVNDQLITNAYKKLSRQIAGEQNVSYYLTEDDEGFLCLAAEVIREIDPPKTKIIDGIETSSGCNFDHEHVHLKERITQ